MEIKDRKLGLKLHLVKLINSFLAFKNWQKAVVILVSLIGGLIAYSSIRYGEPLFFVSHKSQDISSMNIYSVNTLTGHSDYISALTISPDGKILASGDDDNTIKLWNLTTGKLLRTLHGHSDTVSSDGQILASGSWDNTIKLWNLSTGKLLRTLSKHSSAIYSVAISPNGQIIASGSDDTIKLWDLSTHAK